MFDPSFTAMLGLWTCSQTTMATYAGNLDAFGLVYAVSDILRDSGTNTLVIREGLGQQMESGTLKVCDETWQRRVLDAVAALYSTLF